MSDLERVQPDPVKRAIIQLAAILSDHLLEHKPDLERDDTFDSDMKKLHDIRREFDPRIVTDTYIDPDWESEE